TRHVGHLSLSNKTSTFLTILNESSFSFYSENGTTPVLPNTCSSVLENVSEFGT
ncbi:hypothetical protein SK128_015903, partial [Halocaridina rubra]